MSLAIKRSEQSRKNFLKSLVLIIPLILLLSVFSISLAAASAAGDCDLWCKIVYLFTGKIPSTGQITAGVQSGCVATGGTETEVGGYKIHTFTSDGALIVTGSCNAEVLVVGGGGGSGRAGGGGGGGVIYNTGLGISSGSHAVVVGLGGIGQDYDFVIGGNGGDSSFDSLVAVGGGGGGTYPGVAGGNGGSGGGGGFRNGGGAGGTGISGQGYNGGAGNGAEGGGGGGGGASEEGSPGQDNVNPEGGNGGDGILISITGASNYYGGGGGGAAHDFQYGYFGGSGGLGGGGNGRGTSGLGTAGVANTGGGAGGTHAGGAQNGGSGIVIIKYLAGAPAVEICNNGIDDDGDGYTDCADSDCASDPACQQTCANGGTPISDCTGLQAMKDNTAGTYCLVSDVDCTGFDYGDGKGFMPVGNSSNQFAGKLDGQNFNITGLYINRPSTNYVGLFGYAQNSEITNIGLKNVNISGRGYVGGLVGFMPGPGTVSSSYSTGSVKGFGGEMYVGGLVGDVESGAISNSSSTATVIGTGGYTGGLAGSNSGTISGSYATGNVNSNNLVAGGLAGGNSGTISNSYATGNVSNSGIGKIGGLVGLQVSGTITNCYSTGSISGTYRAGGLVGENSEGTILSSYWDNQTSGKSNCVGYEMGSTDCYGKTTEEMKKNETFVNWDFVNTWGICEGTTYPWLQWQDVQCACNVACGDMIMSNLTMNCDLDCPTFPSGSQSSAAITIGANDITLDCAGHTISGSNSWDIGPGTGVNLNGYSGITVKNCVINGIFGVSGGEPRGAIFVNSANNVIINNTVSGGNTGIYLYGSSNSLVSYNTVNAGIFGIPIHFSSGNTISNNVVSGDQGIWLLESNGNNIFSNTILGGSPYFGALYVAGTVSNNIYNNLFNGTKSVGTSPYDLNLWNSSCGGNFWANPSGTGFSEGGGACSIPYVGYDTFCGDQSSCVDCVYGGCCGIWLTCNDIEPDGICNNDYTINGMNIDYMPLNGMIGSRCGNCVAEDPDEQCDGDDVRGLNCSDMNSAYQWGNLSCKSDCMFNYSECHYTPYPQETCGNGVREGYGEQCDDGCLQGVPYECETVDNGDGCSMACQIEDADSDTVPDNLDNCKYVPNPLQEDSDGGTTISLPDISGLALWLNPESLSGLSDGSLVSSWTDSSGNGNNAVAPDMNILPSYYSNQLNGKGVVRFTNSVSQGMLLYVNNDFTNPPVTVIYVGRMTGGMNNRLVGGTNNWLLGYWAGLRRTAFFECWLSLTEGIPADTNWHYYTGIVTSPSRAFEDGVEYFGQTCSGVGPNVLSLGGSYGENSDGEIAEVLLYNKALSDTEREKVEAYLHQKYFEAAVGGDGIGDACDNCPTDFNPDQLDSDPMTGTADYITKTVGADEKAISANLYGYETDYFKDTSFTWTSGDYNGITYNILNSNSEFMPGKGAVTLTGFNPAGNDGYVPVDWAFSISDGFGDLCDNCPYVFNPDQIDSDADGVGDACELVCDDADGDDYGVCPNCGTASGCAHEEEDCNDTNPAINPGATELCNGIDDNCDLQIDEGYNVGQACTLGTGVCAIDGMIQCSSETTSECMGINQPSFVGVALTVRDQAHPLTSNESDYVTSQIFNSLFYSGGANALNGYTLVFGPGSTYTYDAFDPINETYYTRTIDYSGTAYKIVNGSLSPGFSPAVHVLLDGFSLLPPPYLNIWDNPVPEVTINWNFGLFNGTQSYYDWMPMCNDTDIDGWPDKCTAYTDISCGYSYGYGYGYGYGCSGNEIEQLKDYYAFGEGFGYGIINRDASSPDFWKVIKKYSFDVYSFVGSLLGFRTSGEPMPPYYGNGMGMGYEYCKADCVDSDADCESRYTDEAALAYCLANEANIKPGIREICDNGVDDNCNALIDWNDPTCDLDAPEITISISGAEGCNGWYTSPVDWLIRAYDPKSGIVDLTYYVKSGCGNTVVETGEECDDGMNNGAVCAPPYGSSCSYCSDTCAIITLSGGYCGDNVTQPQEFCDGADLNGMTCIDLGYSGGDLACNIGCSAYNTSQCLLPACPTACGSTVTTSCMMTSNMSCTGNLPQGALIIGASGITLDCNGHSIKGPVVGPTRGNGVYLSGKNGITIKNCVISGFYGTLDFDGSGIYATNSANNLIINNVLSSNRQAGVHFRDVSNSVIYNNIISGSGVTFGAIGLRGGSGNNVSNNNLLSNSKGIAFYSSTSNNNIFNNYIIGSGTSGIVAGSGTGNKIYNNYLNNTKNADVITTIIGAWNTTLTYATNIIGGNWLGGNFWAAPYGTGFSETTCTDPNSDGICNNAYTINGMNIDRLPLASPSRAGTIGCGDTITQSFTMTSDLYCPNALPEHSGAINIGANDVTLNCNGHSITALGGGGLSPYGNGVYWSGYNGITVKNCVISGFRGSPDYTGCGVYATNSANNLIINNVLSGNSLQGVQFNGVGNSMIYNNTVIGGGGAFGGIGLLEGSSGNNVSNNNIIGSVWGMTLFSGSFNNNIFNNHISGAAVYRSGIGIDSSAGNNNKIYNNYLNNTKNADVNIQYNPSLIETWNIAKTWGTNIIGGNWLGGNFWANPSGTGFSEGGGACSVAYSPDEEYCGDQSFCEDCDYGCCGTWLTCDDAEPDGICNNAYTINGMNIDYLPLAA